MSTPPAVSPTRAESIAAGSAPKLWQRLARAQTRVPLVQLAILVGAVVVGMATLPGFASYGSIMSMLVLASLVGLASLGQTLVVLVGGFDLSVAGFMVAGALLVTQVAAIFELPFAIAVLVLIIGAALLGALTGYICHRFQIQPIIVTFAVGAIAVGLTQLQTGGTFGAGAPAWLSGLTSPVSRTFGFIPVPPIVMIWLAVAILAGLFLSKTSAGRRLYATGANVRAADNSLIRTRLVWVLVFAFSAVAAGLTGILLAGFAGNVVATLGAPYLFQSLAAVIVGGTVFGGPGDYTRTTVGALMLTVLTTLLIGNGFSGADQQILYGLIILAAVTAYGRERRLRDRI